MRVAGCYAFCSFLRAFHYEYEPILRIATPRLSRNGTAEVLCDTEDVAT